MQAEEPTKKEGKKKGEFKFVLRTDPLSLNVVKERPPGKKSMGAQNYDFLSSRPSRLVIGVFLFTKVNPLLRKVPELN